MQAIIDESISKLDGVIEEVSALLPVDFPSEISEPMFSGMRKAAGKFA
jgi:hypothetical protein